MAACVPRELGELQESAGWTLKREGQQAGLEVLGFLAEVWGPGVRVSPGCHVCGPREPPRTGPQREEAILP